MTFAVGHVAGGTNAGWRIVKPAPREWRCACSDEYGESASKLQPAYLSRCPDCSTRRPS